jgi:hypothetical protein
VPELRAAIAAGFALDPDHASERFAGWFTARAVASERGAKIAHDILRGGQGLVTEHDGTVLRTAQGRLLDCDVGWVTLLEPLRAHPRLGALVRSLVAGNAAPKSKVGSKKKSPKKTTPKRR